MDPRDVTGLGLVFGTAAEGRAYSGRAMGTRQGACPVSESMIRTYCALVEDGNPAYWEDGICPPGLTMTLGFSVPWAPGHNVRPSIAALDVPLPGRHIINVSTDTEFHRPLRVSDEVTVTEEIVDVSEERSTRLGRGHFITTRSTFADTGGYVCAVNTNVILRYISPEDA